MPVFTRLRDGVLVLTVDGDFTANELRRIAYGAFHEDETPDRVPLLLDMSGAAGVSVKSPEEIESLGAIFDAYRDRITGLAIVAPSKVHHLFSDDGRFGQEADLPFSTHTAHAEAREWLAQQE